MPDLADGESAQMQGSGSKPYELKNTGGVYSCTCPAWCNQSLPSNARTCKHIRKLRGDAAEELRLQTAGPLKPLKPEGAEDVKESVARPDEVKEKADEEKAPVGGPEEVKEKAAAAGTGGES